MRITAGQQNIPIVLIFVLSVFSAPLGSSVAQDTEDHLLYLPITVLDFDPGWHWGETQVVLLQPSPRGEVLMTIDTGGRLHLIWDVYPSSEAFIYHTYQTETGWSTPEKIANTLGGSEVLARPLVTPDGNIHLIWYNTLAYGGPYRLMYAFYDGQTWSPEEEVASSPYLSKTAKLNFDENGNIYLVYVLAGWTNNYFHREHTDLGWTEPQDATPPKETPSVTWKYYPALDGGVHFYGYGLDNKYYYSYWRMGQFLINRQVFEGLLSSLSNTMLDRGNNLHVRWIASVPVPGGSVTGLYHQCLDSNLVAGSEELLTGQESIGFMVHESWDGKHRLAYSWKNKNTSLFTLVVMDNCNIIAQKKGEFSGPTNPFSWGDLAAISTSSEPGKFCALVDMASSLEYRLLCADIYR